MKDPVLYITVLIFLAITIYLGYLGYRHTRSSKDYLIGGGQVHPFLVALSYGSTFISTSAIVGFGGAAGMYGLSLLWLTVLNILVGIFIAFIVFGKRTKALGLNLGAHTFPELLARRFKSKFLQAYSAILIIISMPLYAAAVMIGGARFMEQALHIPYATALVVFAVLVGVYVTYGGLKGIIYTDAFQGVIMFLGMVALLVMTFVKLGGVTEAHLALANLNNLVPQSLVEKGHLGWASMPALGSEIWYYVMTTLVLGVGVGVLAQPHLAVRFMALKSPKEMNRAVIVGGIFILAMTGVAFLVGALSNVYFYQTSGKIALEMVTDPITLAPNIDKIIPLYITEAIPTWFSYLFMLTLLSAAMSTLSGQFHVIGTSIKDLWMLGKDEQGIPQGTKLARAGVVIALISTLLLSFKLPGSIIAIATAIFFGLCAASFLPMYIAALFFPRSTTQGVTVGTLAGSLTYLFLLLFVHQKEAAIFGVSELLFGKAVLFGYPWNILDPIVIALPVSLVVTALVSRITEPLAAKHLKYCFKDMGVDLSRGSRSNA